jgi:tetratricopeptide (TPR) repeat protein
MRIEPVGVILVLKMSAVAASISVRRSSLRTLVFFLLYAFRPLLVNAASQQPAQAKSSPAKIEGTIVSSGDPVAAATVWLELGSDTGALEESTDASGKFLFTVPRGGTFRLKIAKDGFRDTAVEPVIVADGETKHLDLQLAKNTSAKTAAEPAGSTKTIQLSDEPNYAIAGVTDWSNVGLHGSDANVRTSEKLAKETATLKDPATPARSGNAGAADAHRLLGDEHEKAGEPVAAVREYEKAVKLDSSEENFFAWSSELLLHRGGTAAVDAFQKAAAAHPKSARIQAGLGAALYADGDYSAAAERVCQAADLNPSDPAAYLFLGSMEKASTEILPCSEARLKRFAKDQPQNPQANYYYGLVLLKLGRSSPFADEMKLAEEYLKKAVTQSPTFGEALVELGLVHNARGERALALEAFRQAAEAAPKLAAAHYNLSLAYRRVGEMDNAEQELAIYDQLHKSDEAELEKERREMRQFVTVLKNETNSQATAPK